MVNVRGTQNSSARPSLLQRLLRKSGKAPRAKSPISPEKDSQFTALVAGRTSNAVIVTRATGEILWVNEGFSRITGYSAQEAMGKRPGKLLQGPETDKAAVRTMRERLARGEGFQVELINYTRELRPYWAAIDCQPVRDSGGAIRWWVAVETDITERRNAERALKLAEEKYRGIFESAVMGVFQTTIDGQFLGANGALARICGYESAEDLKRAVSNTGRQLYVDPTRRDAFIRAISQRGRVENFASEIYRKDGSTCRISESAREVRDAFGGLLYYEGTVQEIPGTIAAGSGERGGTAMERAASAGFLAGLSQEIRAPLNDIIGTLELLRETRLEGKQARLAQIAGSSAANLLTLINDIFDFSRLDAGELQLASAEFDLARTVEQVVEILGPAASARGLEFACFVDPAVHRLWRGDADRLRQTLINLAATAIRLTEKGQVVIRVAERSEQAGQALLHFSVKDTGPGITPEQRERLFNSQGEADRTAGVGEHIGSLGLANSRRFAEMMGGQLGAESEPGKGTTYWFTARLDQCADQASAADSSVPEGLRALIIAGGSAHAHLLWEQLTAMRFDAVILPANTGPISYLRAARTAGQPFKLVLCELGAMSGDAQRLAGQIRNAADLREAVLIAIAPLDGAADPVALAAAGFSSLISKPIHQSRLFDNIVKALAGEKSRSEPAGGNKIPTPGQSALAGARLLIVEENEVNQLVTAGMLEKFGARHETAATLTAAVELATAGNFDVALIDHPMRSLDAFEITRQIRAAEFAGNRARLPILALADRGARGERDRCLTAGMDGYVARPMTAASLLEALLMLLPGRNESHEAPGAAAPAGVAVIGENAPIDVQSVLSRCMHDCQVMERLLDKFSTQTPATLNALRRAASGSDPRQVMRISQALRDSSAGVSAERLRQLAGELEQSQQPLQEAAALIAKMDDELRECIAFIPSAIGQAKASASAGPAPVYPRPS